MGPLRPRRPGLRPVERMTLSAEAIVAVLAGITGLIIAIIKLFLDRRKNGAADREVDDSVELDVLKTQLTAVQAVVDDILAKFGKDSQIDELHQWHNKPMREKDGTPVMNWEFSRDLLQTLMDGAEAQTLNAATMKDLFTLVKELKDEK